jgi:hypothetical protein
MLDDVATKPQTMEEQGYGHSTTLTTHQICMEGKVRWEMVHVREEILRFQVYLI